MIITSNSDSDLSSSDSVTKNGNALQPAAPFEDVPPPYETVGYLVKRSTTVRDDGRIDLDLDSKIGKALATLVVAHPPPTYTFPKPKPAERPPWIIKLNIVIQVVGSRGDVQPFIALGNELQKHGHRVRLATHNVFEEFVRKSGLEFYPIGGDPEELMAYMVKNPGLIPNMSSLRKGDIQRNRTMVAEMFEGCWRSCVEPDTVSQAPFVADAIIANPPSFAHIHCAQALSIPVHLMFTMPWSSTRAFPHPLANLKSTSTDPRIANYISYGIVEWLTWQGLGDIANKWRRSHDLEPVPITEGPGLADTLKIPFTYCWSPALVPKPEDWAPHIDVCGFFFREPLNYTPPPDLDAFLRAGSPPVYIGFGSIVIDDPQAMSALILQAVQAVGVRAIISRGWSKLNGPPLSNVFYLGDCPHEWLFQHVSAVVHHGGAGTTACGLLNGRPTTIVPFFGDQPFWGNMVAAAGAGPKPIAHRTLDAHNLAEAIAFCLTPAAAAAAKGIANKMRSEQGVKSAVDSFHAQLPLGRMACEVLRDRPAVWVVKKGKRKIRVSKLAAEALVQGLSLRQTGFKVHETNPFVIENRRWDPVTGTSSALLGLSYDVLDATADIFISPYKELKRSYSSPPPTPGPSTPRPSEAHFDNKGEGSSRSAMSADSDRSGISTAGAMAAASGKSVGRVFTTHFKGLMVDIPYAATEGLRAVPRMYGEEPRDCGTVQDWKSGVAVAGKTFAYDMAEGLSDLFVQPYKGGREDGAVGVAKGIGKGVVGFATKTASATLGLVAYPAQGISKSIRAAAYTQTKKLIVESRRTEGIWLLRAETDEGRRRIVEAWHRIHL
ncbi:putative UDP-glucose,sterol transferase [Mycena rebaudengoi]|nr:putative UDP-glucose,sterol transferase [Mycena rebaudengoi]